MSNCLKCGEKINLKKDRYVDLSTFQGSKRIEQVFFHINCWKLHFEEKARQKAEAVVGGAYKKAVGMFKQARQQYYG